MPLPANWTSGQEFTASAENAVEIAVNANTSAISAIQDSQLWGMLSTPPTSGWSGVNLGSNTGATDNGYQLLTVANSSGVDVKLWVRSLSPTSNYTASAYIDPTYFTPISSQYSGYGVCLRESSSGKFITLGILDASSASASINTMVSEWTGATGPASHIASTTAPTVWPPMWGIVDDGTNHTFRWSYNGLDWTTTLTQSRTAFLTAADQVGIFCWNSQATPMNVRLRSLTGVS